MQLILSSKESSVMAHSNSPNTTTGKNITDLINILDYNSCNKIGNWLCIT